MNAMKSWKGLVALFALVSTLASAAPPVEDAGKITEQDKKVFRDLVDHFSKMRGVRAQRELQTRAIMNMRQIGIALFEFETEYGSFPSEETAVTVKESTGTKAKLSANTANDCFYQLLATGIVRSPGIFSLDAKPAVPAQIPDHLEKCSFAYIEGVTAAGNPAQPLAVIPLIKGTNTFDREAFGGKAVILRIDMSVTSLPIDAEGRVMVNGMDLLDPKQPYWGKSKPSVRWPAN